MYEGIRIAKAPWRRPHSQRSLLIPPSSENLVFYSSPKEIRDPRKSRKIQKLNALLSPSSASAQTQVELSFFASSF